MREERCAMCGATFMAKSSRHRFCNNGCRRAWERDFRVRDEWVIPYDLEPMPDPFIGMAEEERAEYAVGMAPAEKISRSGCAGCPYAGLEACQLCRCGA